MHNKFNFYDFIGYVIPGSLGCVFLYWLINGFFGFYFYLEFKSIGESILFLALAYLIGHLIQTYGNLIEKSAVREWGGWFSEQFLRDDNSYYTTAFKSALRESIKTVFHESAELGTNDETQRQRRQELFNLCYALIVQEGVALHTEIFNSVYSLYRGLIAATNVAIVVSAVITVKYILLLLLPFFRVSIPLSHFWSFSVFHLGIGISTLILSLLVRIPLKERLKRFAQYFANSVYINFYAWFKCKYR